MKTNRLFQILYYLIEKGKTNANELSEKFEVSVRTIYRDIDALSLAGIPIYTIPGKSGGIAISEDFILNRSLLSQTEKEQILTALKGLENTDKSFEKSDNSFENTLLSKLSALFKVKHTNWIEIDFQHWQVDRDEEKVFHTLKNAILGKRIVSFSYYGIQSSEKKRNAKPVRLIFKSQSWYLYAFCLLRKDFRYFKLSRIKSLKVTDEIFEDDFEDLVIKKELVYENLVNVRLKFSKEMAFRVYDEIHSEITTDEEGNLYTETKLPNGYDLYSYIFSFGENAEIMEPSEIREEMKHKIHLLSNIYKT